MSIGDEFKALLSSFSGKDDTFYVLIINENAVIIDRAMNELQEEHIPNREYLQIPQVKRYKYNSSFPPSIILSLVSLSLDMLLMEDVTVLG